MVQKVNVGDKFDLFDEYWSPKIIGELNDFHVKAVKLKGTIANERSVTPERI